MKRRKLVAAARCGYLAGGPVKSKRLNRLGGIFLEIRIIPRTPHARTMRSTRTRPWSYDLTQAEVA